MADKATPTLLGKEEQNVVTKSPKQTDQQNADKGTKSLETSAPPKLSGAELKKKAKAEKQARRAKEKEARSTDPRSEGLGDSRRVSGSDQHKQNIMKGNENRGNEKLKQDQVQGAPSKNTLKGRDSVAAINNTNLGIRQRGLQTQRDTTKGEKKQIPFFAHLYGTSKRTSLDGTPKDVHPAVAPLGLQISSYSICGSHARCVAMLQVLKTVIASYITPHGTSLPRHLASHFLSPQLQYIKSARPFSVAQANAIRWLKNLIANIDPSVPEGKAKATICTAIDTFIRERFTVADKVITEAIVDQIEDGDVILTYAKSAVVQQALFCAAKRGLDFRVVIADSRPLFEGKCLADTLCSAGIQVTYCFLSSLGHATTGVTKCILGSHAILGNGALYSRIGTAIVATQARECGIPILVCAESIKFTDRVSLDAVVINEVAPEEDLILESGSEIGPSKLADWRSRDNLHILNLMHDLTPAHLIDVIVTELGNLPPHSASVVHRISAGP